MGMSSKGFFEFNSMMAFLKTGPGMNIPEPSKLTTPFWLGAGMFATSSADAHPARSWTDGTIRMSAKVEFKSGRMLIARAPNLLSGRDLVPPIFWGNGVA